MGYIEDTKDAYRNKNKAKEYQDQYIKGAKWARFTMWRQKRLVRDLVNKCSLTDRDIVLDAPCGTGYIGGILSNNSASIVATDISMEMMELAINEYTGKNFYGFLQSDLSNTPFTSSKFKCVIVLALMHRLPDEIRKIILSEIVRLSSRYIIISYSVESISQKLKQWILMKVKRSHIPAPSSIPVSEIIDELSSEGLKVVRMKYILYFLSAKVVFLVEKHR